MATLKELLGQGDSQKPRRNFLQENVRKLKEMKLEKTNKLNSQRNKSFKPLSERGNAQTIGGSSRNLQPQAGAALPRNRRSVMGRVKHVTLDTQSQETSESPSLSSTVSTSKGYRSQGCQTLNGKQLENLYHDGIIRYPSSRCYEAQETVVNRSVSVREMGLQTEAPVEVLHPPPKDTALHWDEEKEYSTEEARTKDFVKMNATIPEAHRYRTSEHFQTSRSDPTRAPPSYQRGVVPKYLREQKKEVEREKIVRAKEAADDCPEGHILLPDEIRLKHLTTLKQNYGELVSQLNQLPVSTDTLRTRTRKKQIEADLDKIEAAIALFSREKVFVKADS